MKVTISPQPWLQYYAHDVYHCTELQELICKVKCLFHTGNVSVEDFFPVIIIQCASSGILVYSASLSYTH